MAKAQTKTATPSTTKVADAPAPAAKKITKETSKVPVKVEAAAAPAVAAVTEPVVESTDDVTTRFSTIMERMQTLQNEWRDIQNEMKKLQKEVSKQVKEASKGSKKKVKDVNKPKRNPSGFAKPAALSKELCDFLSKPYGTELARTDVTKFLTKYIKDNSLQLQTDKRTIVPDAALHKLLKTTKEDKITYFNLQKFMKPHFPVAIKK
jgi:upstream activation factor subunit UAF30